MAAGRGPSPNDRDGEGETLGGQESTYHLRTQDNKLISGKIFYWCSVWETLISEKASEALTPPEGSSSEQPSQKARKWGPPGGGCPRAQEGREPRWSPSILSRGKLPLHRTKGRPCPEGVASGFVRPGRHLRRPPSRHSSSPAGTQPSSHVLRVKPR